MSDQQDRSQQTNDEIFDDTDRILRDGARRASIGSDTASGVSEWFIPSPVAFPLSPQPVEELSTFRVSEMLISSPVASPPLSQPVDIVEYPLSLTELTNASTYHLETSRIVRNNPMSEELKHTLGMSHSRIDCYLCMGKSAIYPPTPEMDVVLNARAAAARHVMSGGLCALRRLTYEIETLFRHRKYDENFYSLGLFYIMMEDLKKLIKDGDDRMADADARAQHPGCFPEESESTTEGEVCDKPHHLSNCSVCLENLQSTAAVPCGHVFCGDCLQRVYRCPICRAAIDYQCKLFLHYEH